MTETANWWITTNYFDEGGQKVEGPFASMIQAIEARKVRESAEENAAYYVDYEERS